MFNSIFLRPPGSDQWTNPPRQEVTIRELMFGVPGRFTADTSLCKAFAFPGVARRRFIGTGRHQSVTLNVRLGRHKLAISRAGCDPVWLCQQPAVQSSAR